MRISKIGTGIGDIHRLDLAPRKGNRICKPLASTAKNTSLAPHLASYRSWIIFRQVLSVSELEKAVEDGLLPVPSSTKSIAMPVLRFLWQESNHQFRDLHKQTRSSENLRNLKALLGILPIDTPADRIEKAEVARELGDYDLALELVDYHFENFELRHYADNIHVLATLGINLVLRRNSYPTTCPTKRRSSIFRPLTVT